MPDLKRPIKPIGYYFELDEKGCLINPAKFSNIPDNLLPIVEQVKKAYTDYFQENLHSLYLRGSLVRGTYQKDVSDVDVIGLVYTKDIKWKHVPFEQTLQEKLQRALEMTIDLELMISSCSSTLYKDYPKLAMVLKTQSCCIWGTDIKEEIPDFKLDSSLLIHHHWLKEDIMRFLKKEIRIEKEYQSIMKMMIRCGFELVFEKEQQFTLDLYPAVKSFGKYYPIKKEEMEKVLFYFLNPDQNEQKQVHIIEDFGNWLVSKIENELL